LIDPSAEIVDVVDRTTTWSDYASRAEFMKGDALRAKLEEWEFTPNGRDVIERYLSQR